MIAAELSAADPANAAAYAANAAAADAGIAALDTALAARLKTVADRPFTVFHDAYGYFERRFGLRPVGAITLSDAARPGPRHLAELREAARAGDIACILTDPQSGSAWADLVGESGDIRVVEADPMGSDLPPGPDLYPATLRALADAMVDCLSPEE